MTHDHKPRISYVALVWLGRSFTWKQKSKEKKMGCTIHLSDMSGGTCCCNRFTSKPTFFFFFPPICFQCSRLFLANVVILWVSELLWRLLLPVNHGLLHWAASKSCVVSYQFQEEWVKCLPTWNPFLVILGKGREAHNSFSSLLGSNHQVSCTMQRTGLL